ncbi:hemolysin-III family protein, partial [Aspergillus aculeatinus CBS 121060]
MQSHVLHHRHHDSTTTLPQSPEQTPPRPLETNYTLPKQTTWLHAATYATLHHETFNIYTHLLPALCFPTLAILAPDLPRLHILSSTACLLLSAAYHANNGHSAYALKADYCGILGLLVSNFVTGLHYAFVGAHGVEGEEEARRWWRDVYIAITILLTLPSLGLHLHPAAAASAAASSSPRTLDSTTTTRVTSTLNNPHRNDPHRTLRVTALIFTGLSALIPITHLYLLHDASYLLAVGVGWYALEGMALILGAVVYLVG